MDTLLIIRDSVAVLSNKATLVCHPCMKESETCENDVITVGIICGTLLIIAFIALVLFFNWKICKLKALQKNVTEKETLEQKNREWKQQADFKNMLLNLQKDNAEIRRDEHGNVVEKYKPEEYNAYKEQLEKLIAK